MELTVGSLVAGGDAIGRLPSGKVVFVEGALPGETVLVELTDTRRDYSRATVVGIIDASPDRVTPACPHVSRGCGGCQWQHASPTAQYEAKVRIAIESLSRIGRITPSEDLVTRAASGGRVPSTAYRTTVRVAFDGEGRAGFRRKSSNDVVAVDACLVAHPMLASVLGSISARPGSNVEVTLRCSTTTGVVGAVVHGDERDVRGLDSVDVVGDEARLVETVHGVDLVVSMGSFFQSGPLAADLLVDVVTRRLNGLELEPGGLLVDAYGGVGLFARALSGRFDEVVLVESNPQACRDAITNLEDCAAVIDQSNMEQWDPCDADVVVADPARQGLGKAGAAAVVDTGATTVVLVSCDPVAGARDARLLVDAGYELGDVEVLDIFPETHHVEVVSVFTRTTAE